MEDSGGANPNDPEFLNQSSQPEVSVVRARSERPPRQWLRAGVTAVAGVCLAAATGYGVGVRHGQAAGGQGETHPATSDAARQEARAQRAAAAAAALSGVSPETILGTNLAPLPEHQEKPGAASRALRTQLAAATVKIVRQPVAQSPKSGLWETGCNGTLVTDLADHGPIQEVLTSGSCVSVQYDGTEAFPDKGALNVTDALAYRYAIVLPRASTGGVPHAVKNRNLIPVEQAVYDFGDSHLALLRPDQGSAALQETPALKPSSFDGALNEAGYGVRIASYPSFSDPKQQTTDGISLGRLHQEYDPAALDMVVMPRSTEAAGEACGLGSMGASAVTSYGTATGPLYKSWSVPDSKGQVSNPDNAYMDMNQILKLEDLTHYNLMSFGSVCAFTTASSGALRVLEQGYDYPYAGGAAPEGAPEPPVEPPLNPVGFTAPRGSSAVQYTS